MSPGAISTADIGRLWLPTAASTSMLTLEIPLLLALAARVGDHVVAVASLGLALAIIVPINAAALALATPSAVARERQWPRRTMRCYTALVGLAGCVALAVVWSGTIDRPVEAAFGVRPEMWDATRATLQGLAIAPLLVAVRRCNQGYLIAACETKWFFPATLARMVTSVVLAAVFTQVLHAETRGIGLALMLGVALEAGILMWRNRALGAARERGLGVRGMRAIGRVHAPLSGAMLLTVLPPSAILLALGMAGGEAEVLAAWPVLFGLAWLVCGTTTDLEPITAANYARGATATRRFALVVGGGLTLLWCALQIDLVAGTYFRDFSGLSEPTAQIAVTGVGALIPFALLCSAREWLRGVLVANDRSRNTLAGVLLGFVAMIGTFAAGFAAGLELIPAAAVSVTAGAAAEVVALTALAADPAPLGVWLPNFGRRAQN